MDLIDARRALERAVVALHEARDVIQANASLPSLAANAGDGDEDDWSVADDLISGIDEALDSLSDTQDRLSNATT